MEEPVNTQHIEATIADVERKREGLAAELRKADETLLFLRNMLPHGIVMAETSVNGSEVKEGATPATFGLRKQKILGIARQEDVAKQIGIAAFAMKVIAEAEEFLLRKDIEQKFAEAGFPVKSNSLSSVLSQLGKAGKLTKFRFDHTMNTVHWGLPEWVQEDSFLGTSIIPRYAPRGPVGRRFDLTDARFDV